MTGLLALKLLLLGGTCFAGSSQQNPVLPGFHPDPSCIFVREWNNTFFCASSSFNAFPGIPIHASQDLRHWVLIGNALSRPEQLPRLTDAVGGTSGIWAPTLRFHDGEFFILTTLVFDKLPINDRARWDNVIFRTKNPYARNAWSDPVHFPFVGYDTSPFWNQDGTVYVQGAHPWQISPHIDQIKLDLDTGVASEQRILWHGTGGLAPEGPHMHFRYGYYYLIIAEGGTGLGHMVTAARSEKITGPFSPAPLNPLLTNANTSAYFQTVGHSDVFQDARGDWWAVALSTRCGPEYISYPMGRETVLTSVTWDEGQWPTFQNVSAAIGGRRLPARPVYGPTITSPESIAFPPGSSLPLHFTHWRIPDPAAYTISPLRHPNTLRLLPSLLNLTGFDANSAPTPQSFVGRRQVHSEFTFSVELERYVPGQVDEEAGVSVFLTQNHHIDFGILGTAHGSTVLRIRTTSTTTAPKADIVVPLPASNSDSMRLEIRAENTTHYAFSYGRQLVGYALSADVSWGFTGTMLGVYATGNGRNASTPVYVRRWQYEGIRQVVAEESLG
ncbi:Glycoside hydrolase family 43 protein [Mycena kentingensis (nom. inval.)]|nr:Glycoside hydrolase family 43 protein [Mycena kentingensis (nom. inval.)]